MSRILPDETRGDQTSTTSVLQSDQLSSQIIGHTKLPLTSNPQNKSGTRRQSQFSLGSQADHPPSLPASHNRPATTTPVKIDIADSKTSDTRQRTKSSPSPLQAEPSQLAPPVGSYFEPQSSASGLEPRSPLHKRPPASRSCHGIETLSGPPPALSTHRSYQGDNAWRYTQPVNLTRPGGQGQAISSIDALVRAKQSVTDDYINADSPKSLPSTEQLLEQPMRAMSRTAFDHKVHHEDEDPGEATLRGADFPQFPFASTQKIRPAHNELQASQEDLFLNLAHADSPGEGADEYLGEKQRRRVRASLTSVQPPLSYRPSSAQRPNSSGKATAQSRREHASESWHLAQTHQTDSPGSNPNSVSRERSHASATQPFENSRYYPPRASLNPSRVRRSSIRDISPGSSAAPERRHYITQSPGPPTPAYRHSNSLYSMHDQYNSSPLNGYSTAGPARRASRAGGTESTVSTTAPSTVWDELETLKSRLNNLELTGRMPTSSATAHTNGSGQRPATAGTTMTTLSSSPKHGRLKGTSLEVSPDKASAVSDSHPLLQSALERAKGVVSTPIFHALETTASDASALAAMTGSPETIDEASNTNSTPNAIDRKLRRKADSICRSLTELCLALSDTKSDPEARRARSRHGSRDTATNGAPPTIPPSLRAPSLEPNPDRVSSRAMSRYEARRTSITPLSRRGSSPSSPTATPTQQQQLQLLPASRTPSVIIRRRTDETERPLSRAMTEAGQFSRAITEVGQSAQRPSPREYTSQHPLPALAQRSPSVQSSLPQRKSYFTTPNYSPLTPNTQPGSTRYLETSTPPSTDSLRMAQARRQQRLASAGDHSAERQQRQGFFGLASTGDHSAERQQRQGFFGRRTRGVELAPGS